MSCLGYIKYKCVLNSFIVEKSEKCKHFYHQTNFRLKLIKVWCVNKFILKKLKWFSNRIWHILKKEFFNSLLFTFIVYNMKLIVTKWKIYTYPHQVNLKRSRKIRIKHLNEKFKIVRALLKCLFNILFFLYIFVLSHSSIPVKSLRWLWKQLSERNRKSAVSWKRSCSTITIKLKKK